MTEFACARAHASRICVLFVFSEYNIIILLWCPRKSESVSSSSSPPLRPRALASTSRDATGRMRKCTRRRLVGGRAGTRVSERAQARRVRARGTTGRLAKNAQGGDGRGGGRGGASSSGESEFGAAHRPMCCLRSVRRRSF